MQQEGLILTGLGDQRLWDTSQDGNHVAKLQLLVNVTRTDLLLVVGDEVHFWVLLVLRPFVLFRVFFQLGV